MPTITLSTPFITSSGNANQLWGIDLVHRVYGMMNAAATVPSGATANQRPLFDTWGTNRAGGQIHLMKGTMPTNLATLTTFSSRSDDVLCTWSNTLNNNGQLVGTPNTGTEVYPVPGQLTIGTVHVAATAAGTATWFWMVSRATTSNTVMSDTIYHSVVGTVGLPGSGADLIIPNVNITVGKLYKIADLNLTLPLTYTY